MSPYTYWEYTPDGRPYPGLASVSLTIHLEATYSNQVEEDASKGTNVSGMAKHRILAPKPKAKSAAYMTTRAVPATLL